MNDEEFEERLEELDERLGKLRETIGIDDRRDLIEEKKKWISEEIQKPRHQIDYDKVTNEVARIQNLEYWDPNEKVAKQIVKIQNIIKSRLDTEGDANGFHCKKSLCSTTRHENGFCMFHYAKEKHGDRIHEEYSEPFNYIAIKAMQQDCREFLKGKVHANTSGAEQCLEQGFTDQTKEWLDQIQERLDEQAHMWKQWIPMGKIVSLGEEYEEAASNMDLRNEDRDKADVKQEAIMDLKQIHQRRLDREGHEEYSNRPQFIDIEYVQDHINSLRRIRNEYMMKEEDIEFHMERAKEFHHAMRELEDLVDKATDIDDPTVLRDDDIKTKQEVLEERLEMMEEREEEKMKEVIDDMINNGEIEDEN